MGAFHGALAVGAHAIETDLRLSRDGVVVLAHDEDLSRCFGIPDKKVRDCDWAYLSTLKTLREPVQTMPRLSDLLEYIAQPGLEDVWVLLDIKTQDDGAELVGRMAETIKGVAPSARKGWEERVVLGCWNVSCSFSLLRRDV